ncbi:MAG: hypothetical protein KDC38_09645 [Planctomycetes bacterium]|nr:hypothetical protein [Planctomycetota bacterium]
MMVEGHEILHADHARWVSERRAWMTDIGRLQDECQASRSALDRIAHFLDNLETRLDRYAEEIQRLDRAVDDHEIAIARHERGGVDTEHPSMTTLHRRCQHDHDALRLMQRDTHETCRRLHDALTRLAEMTEYR